MAQKNDIGYFSAEMGIYPRTLYIVKGNDKYKVISENFLSREYEELEIEKRDDSDGSCMWSVVERNTDKFGYLVKLNRVESKGDIAHEATHVAFETFRDIGGVADEDNQEPFAYLVGWITNRLFEALNYKKFKNK